MNKSTALPNAERQNQARKIDHDQWWKSGIGRSIALMLWIIGLLTLAVASVLTHNHPGPWPVKLTFSRTAQHLPYWSWVPAAMAS